MKVNGRIPFSEWRFPLIRVGRPFCNRPAGCLSVSLCVQGLSSIAPPIRTEPAPKDGPKRGNDDGDGHVAPRVTRDVPPRGPFEKNITRLQPKRGGGGGGWPGAQTFRPEGPWSDLSAIGSYGTEGAKVRPQGALLHFSLLPSSVDTLEPRVTKFGTGMDLGTRYPILKKMTPAPKNRGSKFWENKILRF